MDVVYCRMGNRLPHFFAHPFATFLTIKTGLLNAITYTDHYASIYFVSIVMNPRDVTAIGTFIATSVLNCVRNKQTWYIISVFVNELKGVKCMSIFTIRNLSYFLNTFADD
jgi:hypothetical protein